MYLYRYVNKAFQYAKTRFYFKFNFHSNFINLHMYTREFFLCTVNKSIPTLILKLI